MGRVGVKRTDKSDKLSFLNALEGVSARFGESCPGALILGCRLDLLKACLLNVTAATQCLEIAFIPGVDVWVLAHGSKMITFEPASSTASGSLTPEASTIKYPFPDRPPPSLWSLPGRMPRPTRCHDKPFSREQRQPEPTHRKRE